MVIASLLAGLVGLIRKSIKVSANIWILGLYIHFTYVATLTGGLYSNAMLWLSLLPATTLLLGTISTYVWLCSSIFIMLAMALTQSQGWLNSTLLPATSAWWAMGINAGAIMGICMLILIYEKLNNDHTDDLLKRKQKLEKIQRALIKTRDHKDEFIAVVSHELRTPMNAIVGFTELLKEQVSEHLYPLLGYIQTSAQQLLSVITDILTFSQLQAQKLQLVKEEVLIVEALRSAISRNQHAASHKELQLHLHILPDCPSKVWMDELRFGQILDQLLNNAIKFTKVGRIDLIAMKCNQSLHIDIVDTGIGISPDELTGIFVQFEHASEEIQKRYGGTGLGLSICEKLIELHQGRIGVHSTLGQGSTFWLEIPSAKTDQYPTQPTHLQAKLGDTKTQSFRQRYNELIRRNLPAIPVSYDGKSDFYLFYVLTLIGVVGLFAYTAPSPQVATANLWMTGVLFMGIFLQLVGSPLHIIINTILTIACIHLVYITAYFGGAMSIGTQFFILIPLIPFYLFEFKARFFWLVAALISNALIAYLTAHDMIAIPPGTEHNTLTWTLFNYIPLIGLILFFPLLYKRLRKQTRLSITQKNALMRETRRALSTQETLKNQFIGNVSHELRTPMNAIIGFTNLLGEHVQQNATTKELHSFISQAGRHLMTVIDDMLDYSLLESGTIHFKIEPINLQQIIRNAFFMFSGSINTDQVALRLDLINIPTWIEGDSKRLTQILVNLLSNAVKFTTKGEICLRARPLDEGIEFIVKDTGCGISKEKLTSIFGEFEQASNTSIHRMRGHGLGLSITKRLVEAQHGRILVHSALEQGSEFSCWLPYRTSLQSAGSPVLTEDFTATPMQLKLLVVDDHQLNRLLLRQIVQRVWPAALLHEAINGYEAIEKHQQYGYDIILMDMIMPDLDGVATTRIIRNDLGHPHNQTPILGLTANANDQAKQECLACGMNDIIYKPFDHKILLSKIEKLTTKESCEAN
jgi:signal transduction histidine kinase/CheY-like chemotaxis protein